MNNRRTFLKFASLLPLAGATAACASLIPGQGPLPDLYRLSPKSTFDPDLPTVPWQLVLEQTTANASLNTTKIALQRQPNQMEYYANAGWVDKASAMIQSLLVESFENTRKIVSVGRETVGLRSDFILKTELREFQTQYFDGSPTVLITINAKIVQMPRRNIIGSNSFEARVPATADQLDKIIEAFDQALGKVTKHLVEWSLTTADAAYQKKKNGS
ncbi:ABC-type transport auxiliary lipoprotein family protein [Kiloniella laminariae]|uniref:ABC-type transport auxiliary lipoprotein family protein n=1 Tax=Kiloniella laminariae TaxID=454162 RepID=UPI00035F2A3E|nr:ABC-type transport auxiliary lipoprotein family protein [Kiloniella laminariae]